MPLSYKALFIDLSGVLYEGATTIPGAAEFVQRARDKGLLLRFVTNTASKSRITLLKDLSSMGISVREEEFFTAPYAAQAYLKKNHLRPYCLIHEAIREEFSGFDQRSPNCVVLGDARDDLNYQTLNRAFSLCHKGCPLIGIGMNKYFKSHEGLSLDAGGFIHLIEWAADTEAIIMGKPSRHFYNTVVASTPYEANQCLMVGDDVSADVLGAIQAGLQGCLVRTGKYQYGDEKALAGAARVVDSIANLL